MGFGNGGCRGCKRPVRENPSGEVMVELTLKGREEADLVKRRKNKWKSPGVVRSLAAGSGNRRRAV